MSAISRNNRSSSSRRSAGVNPRKASANSPISIPNTLDTTLFRIVTKKLFTLLAIGLAATYLIPLAADTRTNEIKGAITNSAPKTPTGGNIKLAAIRRLNEYWVITRDEVREESTLGIKKELRNRENGLTLDIYCHLSSAEPVPDAIMFHFVVRAQEWQFVHSSWFVVNYDGNKKDFDQLDVTKDVLSSESTLEQMTASFTYNEFLKMAYSNKVLFNLGHIKNMEIARADRTAWQRLVEYFEVIKAEQKSKANKEENK